MEQRLRQDLSKEKLEVFEWLERMVASQTPNKENLEILIKPSNPPFHSGQVVIKTDIPLDTFVGTDLLETLHRTKQVYDAIERRTLKNA